MSRTRTILGLALLAAGVLIGRWSSAPPAPARRESCPEASAEPLQRERRAESRHTRAAQTRPFLIRPVEPCETKDEQADQRYRVQQARELTALLRMRAAVGEHGNPDAGPEAAANTANEYLSGWVDSVIRTAPDLLDELSAEINASLCADSTSDTELVVFSRAIRVMSELADSRGFDCVLAKHPGEDVVLWSALSAWSASGLPKSDALAKLERSATDPRTARLLLESATAARAEGRQGRSARGGRRRNGRACASPETPNNRR